eukprot:3654780-Lingulodinium_polyedra.AAC.1
MNTTDQLARSLACPAGRRFGRAVSSRSFCGQPLLKRSLLPTGALGSGPFPRSTTVLYPANPSTP